MYLQHSSRKWPYFIHKGLEISGEILLFGGGGDGYCRGNPFLFGGMDFTGETPFGYCMGNPFFGGGGGEGGYEYCRVNSFLWG